MRKSIIEDASRKSVPATPDTVRQPSVGELCILCRHVWEHSRPVSGGTWGPDAHVLRITGSGLAASSADGRRDKELKVVTKGETMWFFLCDACFERHENGDGNVTGLDLRWPEGAFISYKRFAWEEKKP